MVQPQADLLTNFHQPIHAKLQEYLWELGSANNGVFAINHSYYEPHFSQLIETLRKFPACPTSATNRTEKWVQRFREERQEGWVNRGW